MKLFSSLEIKIFLLLILQQITHCLVQNKVLVLGWKIFFFIAVQKFENFLLGLFEVVFVPMLGLKINFFATGLKNFIYRWINSKLLLHEPNSVCFVSQFEFILKKKGKKSLKVKYVAGLIDRILFLLLDHSELFYLLVLKYCFCGWVQRCFVKGFKILIFVIRLY